MPPVSRGACKLCNLVSLPSVRLDPVSQYLPGDEIPHMKVFVIFVYIRWAARANPTPFFPPPLEDLN